MNDLFQYLQDKKGKKIPFEFKLLNNLLTQDDLIINGNLDLRVSNISELPNNLTVNGYLWLYLSSISGLPNNLYVDGTLAIQATNISELPEDLYVGGDLWCQSTPLGHKIKNDKSLLEKYSKQVKGRIIYEYY